jgi:hypothetical protein
MLLGVFVQPAFELVRDWGKEEVIESIRPTVVDFRPHMSSQCESGRIDLVMTYIQAEHFAALDEHPDFGWRVRLARQARLCPKDSIALQPDVPVNILKKIHSRYVHCFRYVSEETGSDGKVGAIFHLAPRVDRRYGDNDTATPLCIAALTKGAHTGNLWRRTERLMAEGTVFCMPDRYFGTPSVPGIDLPKCPIDALEAIGFSGTAIDIGKVGG